LMTQRTYWPTENSCVSGGGAPPATAATSGKPKHVGRVYAHPLCVWAYPVCPGNPWCCLQEPRMHTGNINRC
jgi:hypothetical protein